MSMAQGRTRIHRLVGWLWYWLPPLIVMAAIFHVSSQTSLPQAPGPLVDALLKKLSHVAEYTLLFLLLVRAWRHHLPVDTAVWVGLFSTALYGISDEVHQSFVPRRHANWYDVVIDVTVPLLLSGLWLLYRRRRIAAKHPDLAE
jgi:VanZ family protein